MKANKNLLYAALLLITQILFLNPSFATYKLHIPKNKPSHPTPLFVVLHGFSSSADDIENISRFSEKADQNGFFVLYPETQIPNDWSKCWPYYSPFEQNPEGPTSQEILKELNLVLSKNTIDPKKIYLIGMSAGASMASLLVSCHPDVFQGVALHSGTAYGLSSSWDQALLDLKVGPSPFRPANEDCDPKDFHGKLIVIQGSQDDLVHGRHQDRIIKDFLAGATLKSQKIEETNQHLGYFQNTFFRNSVLVGRSYLVQGLPHVWSGGRTDGQDANGKKVKRGPDVTEHIIQFFLSH